MIRIRKAGERGHADHGWLQTYHTFSFAFYRDPEHMGFRSLHAINENRVQPSRGFRTHRHKDVEILSYVLQGTLEHKDSMGNGQALNPGEFQRISAGTGIRHIEFNPSTTDPVHFYQIWLMPDEKGLDPSYEQKEFTEKELANRFRVVASPDAADGSLLIHQDARILLSKMDAGKEVVYEMPRHRHGWLQVLRGEVCLNHHNLRTNDGVSISNENQLSIQGTHDAEILLFDLA